MDESVPAHRNAPAKSARESASELRGKVVSGKHSIYTHFPKDRNCEIRQRTKITRAPCRRRVGGAVPHAENFGDLITADHTGQSSICSRGERLGHTMDPVVSVQNKNFSGNTKKLAKVLGADEETQCFPCSQLLQPRGREAFFRTFIPKGLRALLPTYSDKHKVRTGFLENSCS